MVVSISVVEPDEMVVMTVMIVMMVVVMVVVEAISLELSAPSNVASSTYISITFQSFFVTFMFCLYIYI